MIKEKFRRLLGCVLSGTLFFGICACGQAEEDSKGLSKADNVELWSVSSSVKVRKEDVEYADKGPAALNYDCVKGETESVQLMLTPKENIKSYELIASSLTNGNGNTISADSFEIYVESYFDINHRSNSSMLYPAGVYPDALIPMELSVKAGENTAEANCNQGIWVVINVDRDLSEGIYRGAFTLKTDSFTHSIPVSVNVYDIEMPLEATMGTVFLNRRENVLMGEHDGSEELMVRYFEEMLDYRITLCDVPVYSGDAVEYAEFIDKYFDNPNMTTYIVPYRTKAATSDTIGSYTSIDTEFFKEHIKALADKSTAERDLVKDAMLYIYSITDEPEMNGGEYIVCEINKDVQRAKQEAVNELLRSDPDYFAGRENVRESILAVRTITTGGVDSEIMRGSIDTYCPLINLFHTEEDRKKINDVCEEYDADIWWYTCIAPRNPFCTYHIDDNLLGTRLLSWMQADYGIEGNLYYDISAYGMSSSYDNNLTIPCNPYMQPYRWDNPQAVNGDGFLVYPGSKYDYFGFLPSIRLMSIRDGMEEYELLKKSERDYEELSSYYQSKIDGKSLLSNLYKKLYTGTMPTTDAALFDATRLELLGYLSDAQSESKFLIERTDIRGERAYISILLSSDYTLKVNGKEMTEAEAAGQGERYTFELDLSVEDNYLTVEIINKSDDNDVTTVRRYLGGRTKLVNSFEKEPTGISVSDASAYRIDQNVENSIEGNSLYAMVSSVIKEDEAFNQNFYPTLTMRNVDWLFTPDFTEIATLELDVKNMGNKPFIVTVNFLVGKQAHALGTFIISDTGEFTHIRLDISGNTWSKLDSVDGISLTFVNGGTTELPDVYEFCLDNMFVTYKQEKRQ